MLKSKKDEWSKYICKLTIMKGFFMSCDYIILILKNPKIYRLFKKFIVFQQNIFGKLHSLVKDKTMSKNFCNEAAIYIKIQFLFSFIKMT